MTNNDRPRVEAKLRNFFGLKTVPFAKNLEPDKPYVTDAFTLALDRLRYLVDRRGIGAVFGVPGTGKSTLIRSFIAGLSKPHYAVAYVEHTSSATRDLYRAIARGFGLEPRFHRSDVVKDIKDRILKLSRGQKIQPVLLLDDAHLLPRACLDEIRILTSFDEDSRDDLTVILAGHPQLESNLQLAVNEAFAQRVVIRVRLRSLNTDEVRTYLDFRLEGAGRTAKLFLPDAVEAIAKGSRGIARLVDRIAEHSLLIAYTKKKNEVDADIVTDALDEALL